MAFWTVDIREAVERPGSVHIGEEIKSVEYIPLETTDDPASLIGGIADFAVTDQFIYVYPQTEPRIALFDRQGRFVRTLIREGQGPGEFSGPLSGIQVVPEADRIYLYGSKTWEFTLAGEPIRSWLNPRPVLYSRRIAADRFAQVAMPFVPFTASGFGIGVSDERGNLLLGKNDFSAEGLPPERTGFTGSVAACLAPDGRSALFKSGCGDTIYRLTPDSIAIALVTHTDNSEEEIRRGLDIGDFANLRGEGRADREIVVADLMETARAFYLRCRYDRGYTILAIDKRSGAVGAERCVMPVPTLEELAGSSTYQLGMLGACDNNGFPVWGRTEGDLLFQVVIPDELILYRDKAGIPLPKPLQQADVEEGNPILLIHHLAE